MTRSLSLKTGLTESPIGKKSQVGVRRAHALQARSADRGSPVGQALPYWLHARLVPHERGTGAGLARRVVSLVGQVGIAAPGAHRNLQRSRDCPCRDSFRPEAPRPAGWRGRSVPRGSNRPLSTRALFGSWSHSPVAVCRSTCHRRRPRDPATTVGRGAACCRRRRRASMRIGATVSGRGCLVRSMRRWPTHVTVRGTSLPSTRVMTCMPGCSLSTGRSPAGVWIIVPRA